MTIDITGQFVPKNNGAFPILEDSDLKGGFRVVDDITARNAIAVLDRKIGMICYSVADGYQYQLLGTLLNIGWQQINTGGGGGGSASAVQETIPVTAPGQVSFVLSQLASQPATVEMFINGMKQDYGVDYTCAMLVVTYLGSLSLQLTDNVEFWYLTGPTGGGGGSQTLAQTLVLGNSTSGTNIQISNGDQIVGSPGVGGPGGGITITGGSTDLSISIGGAISIVGGNVSGGGFGAAFGAGGANALNGGDMDLHAGGAGEGGVPGTFTILGAQASTTSSAGAINISGGVSGSVSGDGGTISIASGSAQNTIGNGGGLIIVGGDSFSTGTGNGGDVFISAGTSGAQGIGGQMIISSGGVYDGTPGDLTLQLGHDTVATGAGKIKMSINGSSPFLTIDPGSVTAGSDTNIAFGSTTGSAIFTGANPAAGPGGSIQILAGTSGDGDGGAIIISAIDASGSNHDGGSITLNVGAKTGGGADGIISLNGTITSATANAGGLTAPALVSTYLILLINGTRYKIPCYAN